MYNHTPGPWEVHQQTDDGRNSVRVCAPNLFSRAHSMEKGCRAVAEAEIIGMSRLQAEANARLIAAAPELLEALKLAEIALCNCVPIGYDPREQPTPKKQPLPIIRAAIAKATTLRKVRK